MTLSQCIWRFTRFRGLAASCVVTLLFVALLCWIATLDSVTPLPQPDMTREVAAYPGAYWHSIDGIEEAGSFVAVITRAYTRRGDHLGHVCVFSQTGPSPVLTIPWHIHSSGWAAGISCDGDLLAFAEPCTVSSGVDRIRVFRIPAETPIADILLRSRSDVVRPIVATAANMVYAVAADSTCSVVQAFDIASGALLWSRPIGIGHGAIGMPSDKQSLFVFGYDTKRIVKLDAATGDIQGNVSKPVISLPYWRRLVFAQYYGWDEYPYRDCFYTTDLAVARGIDGTKRISPHLPPALYISGLLGALCLSKSSFPAFEWGRDHSLTPQTVVASVGSRQRILVASLPWQQSSLLDRELYLGESWFCKANDGTPTGHFVGIDYGGSCLVKDGTLFLGRADYSVQRRLFLDSFRLPLTVKPCRLFTQFVAFAFLAVCACLAALAGAARCRFGILVEQHRAVCRMLGLANRGYSARDGWRMAAQLVLCLFVVSTMLERFGYVRDFNLLHAALLCIGGCLVGDHISLALTVRSWRTTPNLDSVLLSGWTHRRIVDLVMLASCRCALATVLPLLIVPAALIIGKTAAADGALLDSEAIHAISWEAVGIVAAPIAVCAASLWVAIAPVGSWVISAFIGVAAVVYAFVLEWSSYVLRWQGPGFSLVWFVCVPCFTCALSLYLFTRHRGLGRE